MPGDKTSAALTFYGGTPCGFGIKLDFFREMWTKMLCGKVKDRDGNDMIIYYGQCYKNWFGCGEEDPPPMVAEKGFCDTII